jgi:hypothetical protein
LPRCRHAVTRIPASYTRYSRTDSSSTGCPRWSPVRKARMPVVIGMPSPGTRRSARTRLTGRPCRRGV